MSAASQEARRGVYFWTGLSFYAGEFVQGRQQGFGCLCREGLTHLGYWQAGARRGPGVEWRGAAKRRGEWHGSLQAGPCTREITYDSGDRYVGEVLFERKHGQGVY